MSSGNNNPAVFERQLRKIYDCLNIGSNKKAVQEVDRLPKNVKDLTVFKALKALALIRMSKRRQAFEILEEIDPQKDLDEVTLQNMTSCYKESLDTSKIVALYEAAASRKPNDPEIMAHLFMAYVRVFNFKRQKEIALQMYKSFSKKKRLYSFWAIMSLVMQSQERDHLNQDPGPDKKVCLTLAEKMCEKMIDDERSHEEIELYLLILRKQQKHEEEYRFLTGQFCLRITDHLSWFNRRRAYLCLDLKMYSRAFKHYFPTLIQEYPDQIEYYQGLFKSALLLDTEIASSQQQPLNVSNMDNQQPNASNQPASTPVKSSSALAECYDIVEKQCQLALDTTDPATKESSNKTKNQNVNKSLSRTSSLNPNRKRMLRGPFIARLELYHTIISNECKLPKNIFNLCLNQFSSKFPNIVSLLLDFFQSFSKKIICYYDMDYMLNRYKLSPDDTNMLLKLIDTWIKELAEKPSSEISHYDLFHIILNYHMLEHSLRGYKLSDTRESRLTLAKKYIDLYNQHRDLHAKHNKTEFLPVDHYCLLAINSIMTNAIEPLTNETISSTRGDGTDSPVILDDRTLVSLIVMAESAVSGNQSPSNHQIKLLLLKLYSFIGASKQSSHVLLGLDIKHFQIDTLGHLLNPVLYNTGNYTLSRESLETCLEFYAHGIRECFEGLTTSYRDGKFSKIEEISGVLRRLSDSLNATQCVLLRGIVGNINAATLEDLMSASQSFDPFKGLHRMFRCPSPKDTLKDSRDFKVLKSLHFEVNEWVQNQRKQTLEDESLWLRLRYFLMRCVYLQIDLALTNKNNTGTKQQQQERTSNVVVAEEIEYALKEIEALLPEISSRLESATNKTEMYSYLEPEASPFRWQHIKFNTLVTMVQSLLTLSRNNAVPTQDGHDQYLGQLEEIVSDIEKRLSTTNSLVDMKRTLMSLTISMEFISLAVASLVANTHSHQSIPTPANLANHGKSQNSNHQQQTTATAPTQQSNPKSRSLIQQMVNKTEAQLTRLSGLVKGVDLLKTLSSFDKLVQVDEALLCNEKNSHESTGRDLLMSPGLSESLISKVKEKILDSYTDSLREIESTIRRKAKLLRAKI